jgi:ribosome-associated translation inhibitor RaiA
LLWNGRYSVEIWKETERQINEIFRTNLQIKYHNVIMGFNTENHKNHAAINFIIMAVKKRICYKDRLKTHDPATIKSIIEGRINAEKYLERKKGQIRKSWEVKT